MLVFLAIPLILLVKNAKHLKIKSEENTWSREFWMFAGALVVLLSAFQITFVTSVPVWNKLFGFNFAPPVDTVHYFNRWQMPFAVLITLFIGAASYLWYNTTDMKFFLRKAGISAALALGLSLMLVLTFVPFNPMYFLYLFSAFFAVIASIDIMVKLLRKSVNAGGMITHLGFGLFLAGVLITFSNSTTISHNTSGFHLGDEKTNAENQVMIKGDTVPMGKYHAIYSNRETKGRETFYTIDFYRTTNQNQLTKEFTVRPSVNRNERMGNVYNPSTENFWNRDIYTYISYAEDNPGSFPIIDQNETQIGDTLRMTMSLLVLDSVSVFPKADKKHAESIDPSNITLTAHLRLLDMRLGKIVKTSAYYIVQNNEVTRKGGLIPEAGYRITFDGVSATPGKITLSVFEDKMDYIVVKAVINPYINLIWAGAFITFFGLLVTMRKRMKLAK
jgi:cytochrome c-type biogenesis protein CcmF